MYRALVYFIATVHLGIIGINLISVPLLIIYEPIYVWMPLITFLVSPLITGTYCMFNRMENHFREKAGMPPIIDRLSALIRKD